MQTQQHNYYKIYAFLYSRSPLGERVMHCTQSVRLSLRPFHQTNSVTGNRNHKA